MVESHGVAFRGFLWWIYAQYTLRDGHGIFRCRRESGQDLSPSREFDAIAPERSLFMKRILIGIGITAAAGWAQQGRGMGMGGAHGAPMQTPPATHSSSHPTDAGRSAGHTPPDTATRVTSNPAL